MCADSPNDNFLKAIDVCQGIINRMAKNSFLIKGWTLTLVVASLLLKGTKEQSFLAIIPLIMFWLLDAYFLTQERRFRKLYKNIIEKDGNDRSLLDMNTESFTDVSEVRTMFSRTLLVFYGTIFALIIAYVILIVYSWPVIYEHLTKLCGNLISYNQ